MIEHTNIRAERIGHLGKITLDRPESLNALTPDMIAGLHDVLNAWQDDGEINVILLRGAGRAFCAGGDVKAVWEAIRRGDDFAAFFTEEYRLNRRIHTYPKPVVSFLAGAVMGGGAGISVLGSHRVGTEKTNFAMPEVAIGFYPDVGATWFLSRCPGFIGRYLGLTGAHIGAADCLHAGIVTHVIPTDRLDLVERALSGGCSPDQAHAAVDCLLDSYHEEPGPSHLRRDQPAIDRSFGRASLTEVLEALAEETGEWAERARQAMASASPTSLKVTFRQSQIGAKLELARALTVEYRLSVRLAPSHDFLEGVRARLIDRDTPTWQPASLDQIEDAAIDALFRPLGAECDLVFE